MNNGSLGPTPRPVAAAINAMTTTLTRAPVDYQQYPLRDAVRERLASLVNAASDNIALTRSTTEGMNLLAHGLDWHSGDEIVLSLGQMADQTVDQIVRRYRDAIGVRTRFLQHPGPGRPAAEHRPATGQKRAGLCLSAAISPFEVK